MSWPTHSRERERYDALAQYEIMDTLAEEAYDELVSLAVQLFGVPTAMVVFVDDKRQWFKAKIGIEAAETPREDAFCAYTILSDEVMVISDALLDPRFVNNPLVIGAPKLRFYAGAPLISPQGLEVGTFCLIDNQPRELDQAGRLILKTLARQVMALLELRRTASLLALALKREAQLAQLLPICSYCKDIKDDRGAWQRVESYINESAGVALSHGICPSCFERHFPDDADEA